MADFFTAVDLLIDINEARRDSMLERYGRGLLPVQLVREFCTVAVDCGRTLGKSSYIGSRAVEGDIVVTGSAPMRSLLVRMCRGRPAVISPPFGDDLKRALTGRANRGRIRLWIDEPSSIPSRDLHEIIASVAFCAAPVTPTVILLGPVSLSRDTSLRSWSEPNERRRGRPDGV